MQTNSEEFTIHVHGAPLIGRLVSISLNGLGCYGNLLNLFPPHRLNPTQLTGPIDGHQSRMVRFMLYVEKHFDYEITNDFQINIDPKIFFMMNVEDKRFEKIGDLLKHRMDDYEKIYSSQRSLSNNIFGYYANWDSLCQPFHLNRAVSEGNKGSQYLLNLAIIHLYEQYAKSNSLEEYLMPVMKKYVQGYFLDEKTFNLAFFQRLYFFLYLKNRHAEEVQIDNLMKSLFITETLSEKGNEDIVTQAFKALVKFCQKKISGANCLRNESDIFVFHAKLDGLLGLVRSIFGSFPFLSKNIVFQLMKNALEEVHCDCAAFSAETFSYVTSPKFNHWRLSMFTDLGRNIDLEHLFKCSKERVFLSKRAVRILQEFLKVPSDQRVDCFRNFIDQFSDLEFWLVLPLADLKHIDLKTVRKTHFPKELFEERALESKLNCGEIYEEYLNLDDRKFNNHDENFRAMLISIHSNLAHDEIMAGIIDSHIPNKPANEKLQDLMELHNLYPYNSNILHEIAICHDLAGDHEQAGEIIVQAISLDLENELLWQSLKVIQSNLKNIDPN